MFSSPAAPSVPALTLLSLSPHILLPLFLPLIDRLPVGLFFPRCCSLQFSQVDSAWVCSPNLSKSLLCYFCPRGSVDHPPQIMFLHSLLDITLMRGTAGWLWMQSFALSTCRALEPFSLFPGCQYGTSMAPAEWEPRCLVNAGPDTLLILMSCSPRVAQCPVACPVMHCE